MQITLRMYLFFDFVLKIQMNGVKFPNSLECISLLMIRHVSFYQQQLLFFNIEISLSNVLSNIKFHFNTSSLLMNGMSKNSPSTWLFLPYIKIILVLYFKEKNVNVCKLSSVYFYLQNITMLKLTNVVFHST